MKEKPKFKLLDRMEVRYWTQKKTGRIKWAFYYQPERKRGQPREKPTPLGTDYKQALEKWSKIHQVPVETPPSGTVAEVYHAYMEWANSPGDNKPSSRTTKDREGYWGKPGDGRLCDAFGGGQIDDLEPHHIFDYFEARSSKVSAKKELKFIGVLCNWAKPRKMMRSPNPTIGIMSQLKVDETRDIYVKDEWYDLVYKHACRFVRDAMRLTMACHNRPAETEGLRIDHIEGNELVVKLEKTRKKGLREKRLPIEGDLAAYLAEIRARPIRSPYLVYSDKGTPLKCIGNFRKPWDRARDAAEAEAKAKGLDFERFQLKDLRAKAATDTAIKYGIEAARVRCGHTTQAQTKAYIRKTKGVSLEALRLIGE